MKSVKLLDKDLLMVTRFVPMTTREYIQEGELEQLQEEVMEAFQDV